MVFRIETKIGDGKAEAPAYETDQIEQIDDLGEYLIEELCDAAGRVYGPGAKITIERVA